MMAHSLERRRFLAAGAAALAGAPFGVALMPSGRAKARTEAGASAWSHAAQSRMRLIGAGLAVGSAGDGATYRAGVEIRLSAGYKTYWRSPGDSGVPPMFNWARSRNVAGVQVGWPAPIRFEDGAGHSIGYAGEVIFPLLVTAADAALPVELALDLDYAVCEKLCIPAQGSASLQLPRERTGHISRITTFEARLPKRVALGEAHHGVTLRSAEIINAAHPVVSLLVAAPDGARLDDVFAETPGMWAFRAPEITRLPDGVWSAAIAITDRPKGADGRVEMLVTISSGAVAIEAMLALDLGAAPP